MTEAQARVLRELREQGYAVTVFSPEELQGANAGKVEDLMVERGWDIIETD